MTTIYYNDSGCGQGKTYSALRAIVAQGGRHIFAADRKEAIDERERALLTMCSGERPMKIHKIYSNPDHRTLARSVSSEIEEVATSGETPTDIVVLITHEALKLANFEDYADQGWNLWIDEVPAILDQDSHLFHLGWETLEKFYHLTPLEGKKWSEVTKRDTSVDVAALAMDDAFQVLRPFDRRVADPRRTVLANLTSWEELRVKRRRMSWFSVWSPEELKHFDAVFLLGNALLTSVTARLWRKHWPEIEWQPMREPRRPFKPRQVIITCFAMAHTASRKLFDSPQGKANLIKIADHLNKLPPQDMIWTCNRPEIELLGSRLQSTWLTPRKAGSNAYSDRNHVAALYTAKPDDSVRSVLKELGLEPDDQTETTEYEVILQFASRGSIREPNDQRDFHIYVYDRQQAEYLLKYFREEASDYVLWPEIEVVNLGFANDVRSSKRGRKPKVLTLAEQEEKEKKRRVKNAESQKRSRDKRKAGLG